MKHSVNIKTTIHKLLVVLILQMPVALLAQNDDEYMFSSSEDFSYYYDGQRYYQYGYEAYMAGDEKEATTWFRRAYCDFRMDISEHPQNGFSYYYLFLVGYYDHYNSDIIMEMADSALKYLPIDEFNNRNEIEYLVCNYLCQKERHGTITKYSERTRKMLNACILHHSPRTLKSKCYDATTYSKFIDRYKITLYHRAEGSYPDKYEVSLDDLNTIINTKPVTRVDSMSLVFIGKIYYDIARQYYDTILYYIDLASEQIVSYDSIPDNTMSAYKMNYNYCLDYLNESIRYYKDADVDMDQVTDADDYYIAQAYWYLRELDSTQIDILHENEVFRATAKFFTTYPHKLYDGNVECAYITMKSLIDEHNYNTALDFYDTISTRFHANKLLQLYRAMALKELGYYGKDFMVIAHQLNIKSHGDFLDSIDRNYFNSIMYYMRGKYHEAIYYCDLALVQSHYRDSSINRNEKDGILLIRGASYELLSQQTSSVEKRNCYLEKARLDYNEVIEIDKTNSIALARLGRYREAIKYALDRCRNADSIIAHKYQTNEDDFLNAHATYLELSEIYCMSGHVTKAKRSIRKALTYKHGQMELSTVLYMPFLNPIKEEINKLVHQYVEDSPQELKLFVNDTTMTIIEYTPMNNAIYVCCTINGHDVWLHFDPGAAYVQITRSMADEMERDGTLTDDDYLGLETFSFADNSSAEQQKVRLRCLKVGDIELHDIVATISESGSGLLGQSFNSNFDVIVNHDDMLLTFKRIKHKR